jgi:predicted RecA/RadA family phage recombinase
VSATRIQTGDTIDYTPGSAVAAGDVVVIGELVGVAPRAIGANELGAVDVEGVFQFPKAVLSTSALAAGAKVYWDAVNSVATATVGSNKQLGWVVLAAAAATTTVKVKLGRG